jgi:hypothetical protein
MTIVETIEEYRAAIDRAPRVPCGPLGPLPILLIPSRAAAPTTRRRPLLVHRPPARPASPLASAPRMTTLDRSAARAVAPPATLPKKCGGCGTPVATPWLLWNVCNCCGRVRPPAPTEQATRLRHQLAARGA